MSIIDNIKEIYVSDVHKAHMFDSTIQENQHHQ
jgi:hypothetical protein